MPKQISGYCTLCRSRCGTLNTVENDTLIRVEPDTSHPTGQAMCPKGRAAPELVHSPHRILHPMRRTTPKGSASPGWEKISWDEALDEIARRFGQIRDESGPEAVAFGVTTPSGTPLSDSIDWVERFIRAFGSPNIAYGTEVCNWHKDHAHAFTYGCGMPVPDYRNAGLIMLWGHNPSNTWLAQANAIAEGRRAGARLLVIDPRHTALAAQADVWLGVRPGTDAALAMGLVHLLLASGRYDHSFVRDWTNAPLLVRSDTGQFVRASELENAQQEHVSAAEENLSDAWVVWDHTAGRPAVYSTRHLAADQDSDRFALSGTYTLTIDGTLIVCYPAFELLMRHSSVYTPEHVESVTGVPADTLHAAADLIAQSPSVAYHAWSGVAQSTNATQTERAIAILYALTGSFDRPGGNRIYPKPAVNPVNGLDLIPASQRAKALGLRERPLGPPAMGWITAHDMYQAILDARPYRVRAFMGFGTNQLASQGDVSMAQEAFRKLEFHVHCDVFETPTARYADILLPVNTPWEREGLRVGFEITRTAQEYIQLRPAMVSSRGESRSDNDIVFDLADRLGMGDVFFDGQLEQGWNYMLSPLGLTVDDLRREGRKHVALEHYDTKFARLRPDTPATHRGMPAINGFDTETRRVELYSELLFRHGYHALPHHDGNPALSEPAGNRRFPFTLTSAKSGYYCHSQHRSTVSLRKRAPLPEAVIHPSVAAEKGIRPGDWVRLSSPEGEARFVAVLDPHIKPELICAEYGWWQSCTELAEPGYAMLGPRNSNYNSLVSATSGCDPISGSVPMRQIVCDVKLDPLVEPAQRPWTGLLEFQVAGLDRVADGVLELTLMPGDGRPLPDYRPGQHITIEVATDGGQPLTRTYSLIGPAHDPGRRSYRIAVRRQLGLTEYGDKWAGAMSSYLHTEIRVGSRIMVAAPSGNFVLPQTSPQPIVLFAGGIGITPFLSYLESLSDAEDMPEIWLHYANRNGQTTAYGERLQELAAQLPRLSVATYFNQPLPSDGLPPEMPGAHVIPEELITARARFYMCGPPVMMDALRTGLQARGVPAFDIFSEVFRSPPEVDPDQAGSFEVRFMQSGNTTAQWTAEKGTLLGFAEKLGLSVPSGCRVGQCESCAVTIVSGQVRHLHGSEPDDPAVCLTCQAIPVSDVVLDA